MSGCELSHAFAARFRLIALTSTPERVAILRAAGVVPVVGDLDRRARSPPARPGNAGVHLAPPERRRDRCTHATARRYDRRPAQRAVYISTTGVYGDHGGATIDETARLSLKTNAPRRIDAERVMRGRLRAACCACRGSMPMIDCRSTDCARACPRLPKLMTFTATISTPTTWRASRSLHWCAARRARLQRG